MVERKYAFSDRSIKQAEWQLSIRERHDLFYGCFRNLTKAPP